MRLSWFVPLFALVTGCDSPTLVSFNTPELCRPHVRELANFHAALEACGDECHLCIESEANDQAFTYSVSHEENECVCPAPVKHHTPTMDAGYTSDGGDAAASPIVDAAVALDGSIPTIDSGASLPTVHECRSLLHLRKTEARKYCEDRDDCHVCVERVDWDGDPQSYLAHECGCPAAYRVE